MTSYIVASGTALPQRIVANAELSRMLEVSPEWIEANCGIRERRWAAADQSASDLGAEAVRNALNNATLSADRIDYLIGGTLSPDYQTPGIAPIVQRKVSGLRNIPAVDIRVGCTAILYSLQLAKGLVESGAADNVACFGAEAQSKGLDLSRRSADLSMLFGDGAGALIVSKEPHPGDDWRGPALKIEDILIATDGAYAEDLIVRSPGTANGARWFDERQIAAGAHLGSMQGRNVILQAVRKLSEAAIEITNRNGIALNEIDLIVPHQANLNLLRSIGKKLSVPDDRIVVNLDRYGNTSGASAFLALRQAETEGRLKPKSLVLMLAFGAGFTWGAALCRVCL